MEKRKIIMEYYELRNQLNDLKKQQLEQARDQKIEENFAILITGKPKMKILRRKS